MDDNKIYEKYADRLNNSKEKFLKELSEINTIDLNERNFIVDKKR